MFYAGEHFNNTYAVQKILSMQEGIVIKKHSFLETPRSLASVSFPFCTEGLCPSCAQEPQEVISHQHSTPQRGVVLDKTE